MQSRTAPARVRQLPSWLLGQNSLVARYLVTEHLAELADHRYHFSMLAALEEFGPLSQADLGRSCGLDRSDVTAAVNDLQARGLLERRPDPHDRRRNTVLITDGGRAHLVQLERQVTAAQEKFLAPLSPVERSLLITLLTRLADHHAAAG
jgi:MarR family transcriptional regulator, lower aerobic nicotinate degradation pathway regulator